MTCGIYLITNLENGKKYVGQSIDIERRWKQHINHATSYHGKDYYSPLYIDMRVYKIKNFKFEILEKTSYDSNILNAREQYWMNRYNTLKTGYNIIPSNNSTKYSKKVIVIEDKTTKVKKEFKSFNQLTSYLQKCGVTPSTNLDGYLKRCIKRKLLIYNRWYIYYRKDK